VLNLQFTKRYGNISRLPLESVFLVANAFIWYFLAVRILEDTINRVSVNSIYFLIMWGLHFGALAFSAIGGAWLMQKIGRRNLLIIWTLLGVVSPLALLTINFAAITAVLLTSILFGVSLGLGMPNCMEYFKRLTNTENRGRYGGLIMLVSELGLASLAMIGKASIEIGVLILIVWRLFGLIFLILPEYQKKNDERDRSVTYRSVISQRPFVLYLIPWIMFSLVNYLSIPVQSAILGESEIEYLIIIDNALTGAFAIIGGFMADYFGRKPTAIAGFVMLGFGFSVLGLYPTESASWYFYTVVDGVAWGFLYIIFVISVWGDLSYDAPSDKYYAIGVLPYFVSKFLQLVMGNVVSSNISPYALFSFTAFFLFIAILPLVYAPETLSEKHMKERELKSYIEKAKKAKEKYA
jgi:MFS family permease